MPARDRVTGGLGADATPARPRGGPRVGPRTDTPWGYARNRLATATARCYPLRALGAGDVRGRRQRPLEEAQAASSGLRQMSSATSGRPRTRDQTVADATYQPVTERRVPSNEWTRSRSGARPSASSRCPCRRPTTRRGCGTPSSSTSTTAVPDRGPQRLREGLARDPLPVADHPDAGPDRRLQRPGRVHGQRRQRRGGRARDATDGAERPARRAPAIASPSSTSGSSRPGSVARAARPTSTRATRSRTSSSARPTGSPTPPACRWRSAPGTPTTRSSSTAGSASARPT